MNNTPHLKLSYGLATTSSPLRSACPEKITNIFKLASCAHGSKATNRRIFDLLIRFLEIRMIALKVSFTFSFYTTLTLKNLDTSVIFNLYLPCDHVSLSNLSSGTL